MCSSDLVVGDVLMWLMLKQGNSLDQYIVPGLLVTSIVSGLVTCSLLFDPGQYDSVANYNAAGLTGQMLIAVRQWAPTQALSCTTTGGSTSITAVSPTTVIMNGDWVIGGNIPANTRVQSGGGTASITLTQAVTGSGTTTGVRLYFGQLMALTQTAAF